MPELEPLYPSYLPKRIRACPQCRKSAQVQVIVYGMPAFPPSPEEKDRFVFAGCIMPFYDDPEQEPPKWHWLWRSPSALRWCRQSDENGPLGLIL